MLGDVSTDDGFRGILRRLHHESVDSIIRNKRFDIPGIEKGEVETGIRVDVMKGNIQTLDDVGFEVNAFLCSELSQEGVLAAQSARSATESGSSA